MKAKELTDLLVKENFEFITGVPDSIFKDFLIDMESSSHFQHIISNNEGEACALAAGYHLGTGKIPVVYLQNSGLGNCINPLTSLLDAYIYSIPTLLLITWRGCPGKKDEPQHKRMGEILPELLTLLAIPYKFASANVEEMNALLVEAREYLNQHKSPLAILFSKEVLEPNLKSEANIPSNLIREQVLECIVTYSSKNDVIISTTGKTSRELFEIRENKEQGHHQDFLTVGSMGCSPSIALGIAISQPERKVIVVDGDGACLMRLESLALIGHYHPRNFIHILIDNNAYESTGSQKTLSDTVNFANIAKACQYEEAVIVQNQEEFKKELINFNKGPKLIVVKVECYSRSNLGRPKTSPLENKEALMKFLKGNI